jgi:hypothetical protein
MGTQIGIMGMDDKLPEPKSLREALIFIEDPPNLHLCSEYDSAMAKADEILRAGPDEHGLNREEIAAINVYTQKIMYEPLNRALWEQKRGAVKPYWGYIRLLQQALFKVPRCEAHDIYRGIKEPYEPITEADMDAKAESGEPIVWWGFSSCSTSKRVANNFLK